MMDLCKGGNEPLRSLKAICLIVGSRNRISLLSGDSQIQYDAEWWTSIQLAEMYEKIISSPMNAGCLRPRHYNLGQDNIIQCVVATAFRSFFPSSFLYQSSSSSSSSSSSYRRHQLQHFLENFSVLSRGGDEYFAYTKFARYPTLTRNIRSADGNEIRTLPHTEAKYSQR
ncbi:hypothetical protein ANN_08523 [Periplaneta americana]|uniref:Uncharacterized protein n=1 Tax=Periplaneta americana TaxID=6978 RepID=A0ABQ8T1N4_PERAM|nr:hypothetical protein ANN_08523 [Periplaneta americana]